MKRLPSKRSAFFLSFLFLTSCTTFSPTDKIHQTSGNRVAATETALVSAKAAGEKEESVDPSEFMDPALPVSSQEYGPFTPNYIGPVPSDSNDPYQLRVPSIGPYALWNSGEYPWDDTRVVTEPEDEFTTEEPQYDIPIVINESVEAYIEYFNTKLRDRFTLWLERSGRYLPIMRQIFKEHDLPEDLVFVALIESGFNPYAYSRARAVGPWQFIKGTGRLNGLRINTWVDERRDPIKSTRAAARHFKDLYERFGSWPLAMAAYNAGEGKITRALAKTKADDFWELRPTRYIRRETKGYVPKFMAATIIAKNPERFGFTLDYHDPLRFDTVTVKGSADLRVMAKAAGITYKELKTLNPELRTVLTPVYLKQYTMRLPHGTRDAFLEAYARIPDDRKMIGDRYKVRRNDTLSHIAKRFGTTVSLLREINQIPKRHILHIGDTIFIPKLNTQSKKGKTRVASKMAPILMTSLDRQHEGGAFVEGRKILYMVKRGDTLWDISQSFNVSIRNLKKYNGLRRNLIHPGDQLVLGYQAKDL